MWTQFVGIWNERKNIWTGQFLRRVERLWGLCFGRIFEKRSRKLRWPKRYSMGKVKKENKEKKRTWETRDTRASQALEREEGGLVWDKTRTPLIENDAGELVRATPPGVPIKIASTPVFPDFHPEDHVVDAAMSAWRVAKGKDGDHPEVTFESLVGELCELLKKWAADSGGMDVSFQVEDIHWETLPRVGDWTDYTLRMSITGHTRVSAIEMLTEKKGRLTGKSTQSFLEEQVRNLETRLRTTERVAKALKVEVAEKEAKLKELGKGEDASLINRLKLKMRAQYGPKEERMLEDFMRWLIDEQGVRFTEAFPPGDGLEQMVAGIRIAPEKAVVVAAVIREFLDSSRKGE